MGSSKSQWWNLSCVLNGYKYTDLSLHCGLPHGEFFCHSVSNVISKSQMRVLHAGPHEWWCLLGKRNEKLDQSQKDDTQQVQTGRKIFVGSKQFQWWYGQLPLNTMKLRSRLKMHCFLDCNRFLLQPTKLSGQDTLTIITPYFAYLTDHAPAWHARSLYTTSSNQTQK